MALVNDQNVLGFFQGATVTHDIWVHTHEIKETRPEFELEYGHVVQSPDPMGK